MINIESIKTEFLWAFNINQARWKVYTIGGANDFGGTLLMQFRNIGGAIAPPAPPFPPALLNNNISCPH